MNEQLSGRALDRAIAEALGLVTQFQPHNEWWYVTETEDRGRQFTPIPDYSADANAVIDVCSARGWSAEFHRDGATIRKWDHEYLRIAGEWYERGEPKQAAALALLAALTAEAAQP